MNIYTFEIIRKNKNMYICYIKRDGLLMEIGKARNGETAELRAIRKMNRWRERKHNKQ